MKNIFKSVVQKSPQRNAFDLSHLKQLTCNMGTLIPILCEEIVPSDSWRIRTELLIRLAPLASPAMHIIDAYTHYFFVPYRLIWEDAEEFFTGGEDGTEEPVIPYRNAFGLSISPGTLADYLGYQESSEASLTSGTLNALPFRAYQKIYDDYYRDQNSTAKVDMSTASGNAVESGLMTLRQRAWEKDYFTTALPDTQRGDEVYLGMSGNLDVVLDETSNDPVELFCVFPY